VLGGKRLARILAAIEREPGAEVSVECNPETTTEPLLEALAAAGVTRISLGVQSMQSHVLAGLGRQHDPAEAKRAAKLVGEAGFSYNVDLIYGGAFESDDDWVATLETVCGFDPPPAHVSAYALSVEPGTPLAFDPARHPDDDVQAQRYAIADAILSDAGLEWYELSSWARPGSECRHNLGYWRQGPYCGLGCAAHSHRDGRRSWNIRPLERYLQAIATRGEATAGEERLGPAEVALERLELSLRTREGVHVSAFDPSGLAGLREEGPLGPLVRVTRGRVVLTLRGRLLYNEVACRLMTPYVLTPIGQG
jgi:coproporphyrinogen III oxidase-like Fe-S oxidoreductase